MDGSSVPLTCWGLHHHPRCTTIYISLSNLQHLTRSATSLKDLQIIWCRLAFSRIIQIDSFIGIFARIPFLPAFCKNPGHRQKRTKRPETRSWWAWDIFRLARKHVTYRLALPPPPPPHSQPCSKTFFLALKYNRDTRNPVWIINKCSVKIFISRCSILD